MKSPSKEFLFQPVRIDVQCGTVNSILGNLDHVLTPLSVVFQDQSTDRAGIVRAKDLLRRS